MTSQTQIRGRPSIHFSWGGHGDEEFLREMFNQRRINVGDIIVTRVSKELVHLVRPIGPKNPGVFTRYLDADEDNLIKQIKYVPTLRRGMARIIGEFYNPKESTYQERLLELQEAGLT